MNLVLFGHLEEGNYAIEIGGMEMKRKRMALFGRPWGQKIKAHARLMSMANEISLVVRFSCPVSSRYC